MDEPAVAIAQRFAEELSGVQEEHRRRRIDAGVRQRRRREVIVKVVDRDRIGPVRTVLGEQRRGELTHAVLQVADWRVDHAANQKIKKTPTGLSTLSLIENPDILHALSTRKAQRPRLVVGFAAETENVVAYAQAKRAKKGCDWILANDVSDGTGTFGGDANTIHLVSASGVEDWPTLSKQDVAQRLARRIADHLRGAHA